MSEVIKTRVDLDSVSRLLERGIIMHSALTPSDASHVLGNLDAWDAIAAQKTLLIFGRMRTGSGEILSKDSEELAQRIIDQLTDQTSEVILETAFGEEDIDGRARDLARHTLIKKGLKHHRNIVSLDVAINLPIIGLGASARTYYGEVGKRLSTNTILPKHGGVANAIGAVVGQITMRESGKIISGGEGVWRVFTDNGPIDYNEQKVAYDVLRQGLIHKVKKAAKNAGADDIRIQFEDSEQVATIEGRKVFVEGSILAIATGRPRISE
jgi:N-methylhydantoinase A/oxoprolinase/acetone carboxylase beta subunit